MKHFKVLKPVLVALVMFGLIACQGKKDNEAGVIVAGNVSSDSQSLFSNSVVNGQQVDIIVSQIMMDQFFNYGNVINQSSGNLRLNLVVNGIPRQLFLRPAILDMNTNISNNLFTTEYLGAFELRTQALCEGVSCESVFVNLTLRSNFGVEAKQIGFYYSRLNSKILSVLEHQGAQSQLLTTSALINQLRSLANQ